MRAPGRALALATVTAVATLLAPGVPSGPATAADPAVVLDGPDPYRPLRVDTDQPARQLRYRIDQAGGSDQVTLEVSGDGVSVSPASQTVDTTGDATYAYVRVRTTSPGLHEVVATASAPDAEPVTARSYVWAAGGDPLPATGDLTGVRWGFDGGYDEADRYQQSHDAVWFLDDTWAYVGIPVAGRPGCHVEGTAARVASATRTTRRTTSSRSVRTWSPVPRPTRSTSAAASTSTTTGTTGPTTCP